MILKRYKLFSNKDVLKRLLDEAKRNNTEVYFRKGYNGVHINKQPDKVIKNLENLKKSMTPVDYEKTLKLVREKNFKIYGVEFGIEDMLLKKDVIVIGTDNTEESQIAILAHELGHGDYRQGRGGFFGSLAHKMYGPSYWMTNSGGGIFLNTIGGGTCGLLVPGKKGLILPTVVPLFLALPMLIVEAAASIRGYKKLKEAGADEELLNSCKKFLRGRRSFGSYLTVASYQALIGLTSAILGKSVRS